MIYEHASALSICVIRILPLHYMTHARLNRLLVMRISWLAAQLHGTNCDSMAEASVWAAVTALEFGHLNETDFGAIGWRRAVINRNFERT